MPGSSRDCRPDRLPAQLTTFVGRRHELSAGRQLLAGSRLTTLIGPGGVGKTRLAVELAGAVRRSFPDGVWMIELASLTDPADVAEAVAAGLDLRSSSATVTEHLVTHLGDGAALLVLDNCEHVLPGCQALADLLLRHSPNLRILATSRQPLAISGEQTVAVGPLETPDPDARLTLAEATQFPAVRLLAERAAATSPHFRLTDDNVAAAAQLCARLDGLPLAIELAAARLRSLSLEQLLARIEDRFSMLTGGDPTALPRHQTLRALVSWSYDLCSAGERDLWARASVFSGGADLDALESTCSGSTTADRTSAGCNAAMLDLVDGLVAKSILLVQQHPGGVRYRMLESLAQFGMERLEAAGEVAAARKRHREHYLNLAKAVTAGFWGPDQASYLARLEADHGNLARAFDSYLADEDPDRRRQALVLSSVGGHGMLPADGHEGARWRS